MRDNRTRTTWTALVLLCCAACLAVAGLASCGDDDERDGPAASRSVGVLGSPSASPSETSPTATREPEATVTSPLLPPSPTAAGPSPTTPLADWGNAEIYLARDDGGEERRLTDNPGVDGSPAWSPDGQQIAFMRALDGRGGLHVMDADGGNVRLVAEAAWSMPVWSPDGAWIAFESAQSTESGYSEVFVVRPDGSGLRQVTSFERIPTATLSMGNHSPAWSPDASQLAVVTEQLDGPSQLTLVEIDGDGTRQLTDTPERKSQPAWSPDGSRIVFGTDEFPPDVWLVDVDGSDARNLTASEATDLLPQWSPDGIRLAWIEQDDAGSRLVVAGGDGTSPTPITDSGLWVMDFRWAPDGERLVVVHGGREATDLYVVGADGGEVTQLTDAPAGNDSPTWSPDGEWVAFTSTRDGGQPVACSFSVSGLLASVEGIEGLAWESSAIVVGTVVEELPPAFGQPQQRDEPAPPIYTDYTFEVEEQWRGHPLGTLTLRTFGGTIGECVQTYDPELHPAAGQRLLLFLHPALPDPSLPEAWSPDVRGAWLVLPDDTLQGHPSAASMQDYDGLSLAEARELVLAGLAADPPPNAVPLEEAPLTP